MTRGWRWKSAFALYRYSRNVKRFKISVRRFSAWISSRTGVWAKAVTFAVSRLGATWSAVLSSHTPQYCPGFVSVAVRGDLHVITRKRRHVWQQCRPTAVSTYWPVSSPIHIANCAFFGWQRGTLAILSSVSRNIDWKSRPAEQPCDKRWGRFSFAWHV